MAISQAEISANMIKQLRLLDPSVGAEVGSPERKIIDTVAQELANAQIDLAQLNSAFDIESKFGTDLDNFLSIFGFTRQSGAQATGFITFARSAAASFAVPIPQGTQVEAPEVPSGLGAISLIFATTAFGEIAVNGTQITLPVRCITTGTIGNVAANKITAFSRAPIIGVTSVTNPTATTGGANVETDAEFKVRFKNTVFRNLAGTLDQYLALAISTAFTTKANVVGPISRYQEYVQIPAVDDSEIDPANATSGNGSPGEWTTSLSTIPYSKHVYETLPYYISKGNSGQEISGFFREEVDFKINTSNVQRDRGDTYRNRITSAGPNVYTDTSTAFQPNVTFFNIYRGIEGESEELKQKLEVLRPEDIVLFEHSYMSSASRNSFERQILNCIDVFINGQNPTQAEAITTKPSSEFASINQFVTDTTSPYYFENFRRVGFPERRPVVGNFFMGLFWTPILSLPPEIITANGTFLNGVHYWAIEDISEIGRSVRARTGIEWNPTVLAKISGNEENFTGSNIIADTSKLLEINEYTYDKNIVDLQTTLEANKQVTTDVLAHQSKTRYFKLDLTVMYNQGVSLTNVNSQIQSALETFLNGAYFGTTIQLSDLLQVIHGVSGVDNVRWSKDVLEELGDSVDGLGNPRYRVVECDQKGNPLCNFQIDRKTYGTGSVKEVQIGYFTGNVTSGTFQLEYENHGATITYGESSTEVGAKLEAKEMPVTVTGNGTPLSPFIFTFKATGYKSLLVVSHNLLKGSSVVDESTIFDTDFFLKDNELPALPPEQLSSDTLPGLIIRKKAQGTWGSL